jgi:hypothetical protein
VNDGELMVTAAQLSRLDARLDALGAAIDTDSKPITVVVFQGESLRSQRHRELRPDHTGRLARFEHRNDPRTEVAEMLAFHTPDVLQAKMDRIEAEGRGLTVLPRMLRDAHGWDDENDRPNHPD